MSMGIISRETDYAVRALIKMAQKPKDYISVGKLITYMDLPRAFLRKILQVLQKKGILSSTKGVNGGFILALSPEKISLYRVISAFHDGFSLFDCRFKKKPCNQKSKCNLRKELKNIELETIQRLKGITIGRLLTKANTE